ncbi:MAG: alpha/beta fold hydrolase [Flavisolibacter sp.]
MQEFFAKNKIQSVIGHYEVDKRNIYYASIGEDHLPAILFIHGSPGSIKDFLPFYIDPELIERFSLYAIDRPGYGLTNGGAEPKVLKQSEMISVLTQRIHRVHQPLIIFAQDYGALVATCMAMQYPNLIQGLVLLDLSLSGRTTKKSDLVALFNNNLFRKWRPVSFQMAAIEKRNQGKELKKILPSWKKIVMPVTCLYSEKNAAFSASAKFLKEQLAHLSYLDFAYLNCKPRKMIQQKEKVIREKILNIFQMIQPH